MSDKLSPLEIAKGSCAEAALAFVEDGMTLGLGTGSTASWFVELLSIRVREQGLKVTGVPTSIRTGELADSLGIPLTTLDEAGWLDLAIDGTDEFDPALRLIKGGGGALLQEKIVAAASDRFVVIADQTKEVATLGAFPLPVEIVPFGWETTQKLIGRTLAEHDVDGRDMRLRMAGAQPFMSDENHFIVDIALGRIGDPAALNAALNQVPGVVDTGLFVGMADCVICGSPDGTTRRYDRN